MRSLAPGFTHLATRGAHLVTAAIARYQYDLVSLRAMGLTYTTLLSLVPLLAVTFSVLKAFGVQNQLEPVLAQTLQPLGPAGSDLSQRLIEFVNKLQVGVLGAVGVAGLFYTVISLIGQMEDALNAIWWVHRSRSLGQKFRDYLSVVLVGPVLVFTAFALTASAESHWLVQRALAIKPLGLAVILLTRVMPWVFLWVLFTFLYRFLPCTHVRLSSACLGGAVASLLWQGAGAVFATFVASSTRYAAIYSSFALVILFLLWLYAGWLVVLVGAEVAHAHQDPSAFFRAASPGNVSPLDQEYLVLSALVAITQRYLAGQPPWTPAQLAATCDLPLGSLEEVIATLVHHGVLLRTSEPEGIVLGRPPEHLTGMAILEALWGSVHRPRGQTGADPVWDFLQHREQVLRQALADITLQELATRQGV